MSYARGPHLLTRSIQVAVLCGALGGAVVARQTSGATGPEQPLPFSHKLHLSRGLECRLCHEMPEPGDAATLPATSTCMGCHATVRKDSPAIVQLASLHQASQPVPWKRVYAVPSYVFFSHKAHVSEGGVECEACHGPVREMEVMQKVRDTSMASCTECHQERGAPTGCDVCHEPR